MLENEIKYVSKELCPHYQVTALIREHIRADLKCRTVLSGLSAEYDIVGTHMQEKKLSINQQCILTSGWCAWSRLYSFSTRCIQDYQERHPEMHSHTKAQLKKREDEKCKKHVAYLHDRIPNYTSLSSHGSKKMAEQVHRKTLLFFGIHQSILNCDHSSRINKI